MRSITLRQLRAVLAVHRNGRIVSAAKALGLTQPAVTLQIKDIETAVGLPLFDRFSDGLRPTDAGRAVIDAATVIEERLIALADEINAFKGVRRGALRLGIVSTAKYFAPALIAEFGRHHPGIEITLREGNRAEIVEALRDHRIDIALMGRQPREVPVRAAAFGAHPFIVIAGAGHPLVGVRAIEKAVIAQEHFLVRERGSGTRSAFEFFFSDVVDRPDNFGSEMGSNETIKQAVMAGLGIAFISGHTVAQELELGRLRSLDVVGMPIFKQWFAVAHIDHTETPSMAAFSTFLAEQGEKHLPDLAAYLNGIAA